MRTWGPGAFLCAPSSSPPISHVSSLQPSWSLHPSSCFKWPRHKATRIHLHDVLGAACAQGASVHPPAPTPNPKLTPQGTRTSSEVRRYGLSFSYFSLLLFKLTDLSFKLFSKTTKGKNMQNHEALGKSHESAAPHDARGHWHGQSAEQETSALPT